MADETSERSKLPDEIIRDQMIADGALIVPRLPESSPTPSPSEATRSSRPERPPGNPPPRHRERSRDDAKSEPEEAGASRESDDDSEDTTPTSDDADQPEEAEAKPPAKKKSAASGGFQRRIAELQAARERDQEQITQLIDALARAGKGEAPEDGGGAASSKKKDGPPAEADFDTHDEYIAALIDYKVEQRVSEKVSKERENISKQTRQEEYELSKAGFMERVEREEGNFEDYREVAFNPDLHVNAVTQEIILGREFGPEFGVELLYDLGSDLNRANRILKMSPAAAAAQIGVMIGEIKARRARQAAAEKTKKSVPGTTTTITAGGGASIGAGGPGGAPANETMEAYAARRDREREAEIKRRRG